MTTHTQDFKMQEGGKQKPGLEMGWVARIANRPTT
jgi:hypothetical protein